MKKNESEFAPIIDFKSLTPEVLIGDVKQKPMYERAYLISEDGQSCEFAENTAAWDS